MAMTRRPAPGERSPESERGRVERPVRACKPRSHDLDHERDVRAARAAESEKRATESRLRIGGRLSVAVHRPARGQRLASFRVVSELDKGGRAGRLVDQQRRPFDPAAPRKRSGSCNRQAFLRRRPSSAPVRWSQRTRQGQPRRDDADNSRVRPWCSFRSARTARCPKVCARSQSESKARSKPACAMPPLASQWIAAGAGEVMSGSASPTIRPARKAAR